ncbi:MAG TPA: BON domain-containing protein, partial [Gemmataceae bacterium]|nr:BON domain-containing protein [Gemmataceae bacterium]
GTYANPLYFGRPGATGLFPALNQYGGGLGSGMGFGQPSFGTVSVTSLQTTGRGTTTGRTGTATTGGFSGASISARSPISYATVVAVSSSSEPPSGTPAVNSRLRAELQGLLSRTTAIREPSAITLEVVGNTVILRGRVSDEDERRLVEGMVALEPGVHEVRNELEVR